MNLPYFAILLDNNIIIAMQYLKTKIVFKNFGEKKAFNQTIGFVFEKLLQKWGFIISGRSHRALTNEIRTLKLTISTTIVISYSQFQFTSCDLIVLELRPYYDTVTERN